MESKYSRLLGNSLWTFLGNAGSKILSFLLLPFYTKWLGTSGFGFSDLITTYASLFGGIVTLCISDALLIFIKDKSEIDKTKYYSSAMSLSIGLLVFWGIIVLAIGFFHIGKSFIFENIFLIFSVIITNFLQTSSQQMVLALNKIKIYSFSGIILCVALFVFSWLLIPRYGVNGYVYAILLANLLTAFYSIVCSSSWRYFSFKYTEYRRWKEVALYSIPLIPNAVMWWLVSSLNRPLMENHLGLSAIGIFSVANRFPAVITLLYSIFAVSWGVSVIEEYGKPQFERFNKQVYRALFSIIVIGALILMLLSNEIISLLAAPEFFDAYKYMIILLVGSVFSCMSSFWGACFAVVKQTKYYFYSSIWGALAAILFNYILIPSYGLYGAAFSVVLSFIVMAVSRYIYSLKYVRSGLISIALVHSVLLSLSAFIILYYDSFVLSSIVVTIFIILILLMERESIKILIGHFIKKR